MVINVKKIITIEVENNYNESQQTIAMTFRQ